MAHCIHHLVVLPMSYLEGHAEVEEGSDEHVTSDAAGVRVEEEQVVGACAPAEGWVSRLPCLGLVLVCADAGRLLMWVVVACVSVCLSCSSVFH